jgi:hypothetical protein
MTVSETYMLGGRQAPLSRGLTHDLFSVKPALLDGLDIIQPACVVDPKTHQIIVRLYALNLYHSAVMTLCVVRSQKIFGT